MWMMGYADGGDFSNNIQDSINGRRLRPLVPRTATASASTNPPCLFHGSDLFSINHHFAMVEQNKRELNTQQVVVSSRWNPTPEQLQALEDLYRRGTRTPSAEQIQHITAELRRYGKIEGKNVFYWFQNHKARERQKRRRQLDFPSDEQPQNNNNLNGQKKESLQGANRTTHEVEQANYWASPTNSSTIPAEKTLSRQGASKAEADSKSDGWVQFDDTDDAAADHLQQQQRKNATWQMQNMSCSSSPQYPTNLINSSSAAPTSAVTQPSTSTIIPSPLVAKPNFVNMLFLDKPYFNIAENPHQISPGRGVEAQTLDLFPILGNRRECINDEYGHEKSSEEEDSDAEMINSSNGTHGYQFFEFLPLKN